MEMLRSIFHAALPGACSRTAQSAWKYGGFACIFAS
jgi:hypothetical protein